MSALWNDERNGVIAVYKDRGVVASKRVAGVTKEMLHGASGKFFNLSRVKADELRHLVPVLGEVLRTRDNVSDRDGHRVRAFEQIAKVIDVVHDAELFLSLAQHAELKTAYVSFYEHYNCLRHIAAASGRAMYNITIKFHAMHRVIHYAQWCNPSAHWAYGFEDFMGKIVRAAQACSHGTPPHLVGARVLENYRLALHLQMR